MDDKSLKSGLPTSPERFQEGSEKGATPISALVRVAVPLTPQEKEALARVLSRLARGPVELKVEITPEIIGGVWVRVGDKVMDGTLRKRLEALRQHLIAQCRALVTDHILESENNTAEGQK